MLISHTSPKLSGFTIVELLIVIVIIGILGSIVIVAFGGIQNNAKNTERKTELASVQKALEQYYIDNGGYPRCASGVPNTSPFTTSSGTLDACLGTVLVPKYANSLPKDPTNDGGQYTYRYAAGYKKTGATAFSGTTGPGGTPTDNYILGTKEDGISSPSYGGWGQSGLTLLIGSDR